MCFIYFRDVLSNGFRTLVAFLLLALILVKVASFHTYAHTDDSQNEIENCLTCELAVQNQQNSFLIIPIPLVTFSFVNDVYTEQPSFYSVVVNSSLQQSSFFCRPPPSYV